MRNVLQQVANVRSDEFVLQDIIDAAPNVVDQKLDRVYENINDELDFVVETELCIYDQTRHQPRKS